MISDILNIIFPGESFSLLNIYFTIQLNKYPRFEIHNKTYYLKIVEIVSFCQFTILYFQSNSDPCRSKVCGQNEICVKSSDDTALCQCPVCQVNSGEEEGPVCADNGQTFASRCHMKKFVCEKKNTVELNVLKDGPCGE